MQDIYVTHDWRDHDDRTRSLQLLDDAFGLDWRNFGTPWYDPALKISSEDGAAIIRRAMEDQVRGARVVLFLPGVYCDSLRGRTWVGYALGIARGLFLPVIGMEFIDRPSPEVQALADCWVRGSSSELRRAIETT